MIDRDRGRRVRDARQAKRRRDTAAESVRLPPPTSLGAPAKFTSWRPGQAASVIKIVDMVRRVLLLCLPTGAGKSLTYVMGAVLNGGRVIILTSTKGLQDQLLQDFTSIGAVDIRGQSNYACIAMMRGGELRLQFGLKAEKYTCDDGLCHAGVQCSLKGSGCTYYDDWRAARSAEIVITNYSKWFHEKAGQLRARNPKDRERLGLGEFDVLICDEAHEAVDELCSFLRVEIKEEDCRKLGITAPRMDTGATSQCIIQAWKLWSVQHSRLLQSRLEDESSESLANPTEGLKRRKDTLMMIRKLESINEIRGQWIASQPETGTWRFDPVWPAEYAEMYLFQRIPKVVLSSATVREKTGELLGLKSDEMELYEQGSSYPVTSRPVISVPCAQMNWRTEKDEAVQEMITWQTDKILNQRSDRKGVIHTVSYKRRNHVLANSRFQKWMLVHDTRSVRTVISQYKSASPPRFLVSPSVSTGYDFPYDECEFQIIMKIPFPDTRDLVVKERCKEDPDYGPYTAMQTLVQMSGRGMRAPDDMCETLVLDENIKWFIRKYAKFAPKWFIDAYREEPFMPKPPIKLTAKGRR